ncbi:MAG: DUF1800 family protein [Planctomycetes bacterium]|nr:DUF1800 family protein [Planctomycetota bacterium]
MSATLGLALGAATVLPGQAIPINEAALHALNRITFGATLPLLQQLSLTPATGPSSIDLYIDEQLTLAGAENPLVPALLAQLATPRANIHEVKQEQFIRACFSRYQLREVMTQFWQRHFNTHYAQVHQIVNVFVPGSSEAVQMIDEANQAFRAHALGRFEDLLLANLDSRAMILYLSLFNSRSGPGPNIEPNEDFARENKELYTLGPEENGVANYSHADIEAAAECFAGYNVFRSGLGNVTCRDPITGAIIPNPVPLQLVFIEEWHEAGQRVFDFDPNDPSDNLTIQGVATSGAEARQLMAWLARMAQTKRFVCRKLIDFFLADGAAQQEPALLLQCTQAWGNNGGDIAAVLEVILKSAAFQGPTYRWQRLRMPMEFTCWMVRALDGTAATPSNLDDMIAATGLMGQSLHDFPSPDGYPTLSRRQPGTQIYIDAANHARGFLRTLPPYTGIVIHDLPQMVISGIGQVVPNGNPDDPADVARYFLRRLYVGRWTADDHTRLTELTQATIFGVLAPLDHVGAPVDYRNRIHLLAALAAVLPQGLKK